MSDIIDKVALAAKMISEMDKSSTDWKEKLIEKVNKTEDKELIKLVSWAIL